MHSQLLLGLVLPEASLRRGRCWRPGRLLLSADSWSVRPVQVRPGAPAVILLATAAAGRFGATAPRSPATAVASAAISPAPTPGPGAVGRRGWRGKSQLVPIGWAPPGPGRGRAATPPTPAAPRRVPDPGRAAPGNPAVGPRGQRPPAIGPTAVIPVPAPPPAIPTPPLAPPAVVAG